MDAAAATELDTKQALQAACDFAVRQAALFVYLDDGSLGIRSQLGGGGTESVRSLQGMASLNPPVALTALADVDVELAVDGLARNLHLELLGDVGFVERAATIGAAFGQGCLVSLIDLFGSGRLAMRLGAVVLSWLASGFLGFWLGLALSEGSSLALAGTGRLIELPTEALVLGLQVAEASLKGLAAGTRDGLHASIIGEARDAAASRRPRRKDQLELDAPNQYHLGRGHR
jgi:hypothetical protein